MKTLKIQKPISALGDAYRQAVTVKTFGGGGPWAYCRYCTGLSESHRIRTCASRTKLKFSSTAFWEEIALTPRLRRLWAARGHSRGSGHRIGELACFLGLCLPCAYALSPREWQRLDQLRAVDCKCILWFGCESNTAFPNKYLPSVALGGNFNE